MAGNDDLRSALSALKIGDFLVIVGRRSFDNGETWLRSRAHPWWKRGFRLSDAELSDRRLLEFGAQDPAVSGDNVHDTWRIKFRGVR